MALTSKQVDRLLTMIRQTSDVELTCPECLDELDRFAQAQLDGAPLGVVLKLVREHLDACPFCSEEFKLVLETLAAMEES
jgi:predicted anti-sigma-YlaC factor YlaD